MAVTMLAGQVWTRSFNVEGLSPTTAFAVVVAVLFVAGLVVLWRLIAWGSGTSTAARTCGELFLLASATLAWTALGAVTGIIVIAASTIPTLIALIPIPWVLLRANLLRSRSVQEAVANSRTLWQSFDYRPSDSS